MKLKMCLEVIWWLLEGHLEDETGYESRSGGYLVVTRRTSGILEDETGVSRYGGHLEVIWLLPAGRQEFWRMKLVMFPDLEVIILIILASWFFSMR